MKALPTFRQLQFFVALAQRGSFSRAADDCLVSQSTLSAAIKELELTLNVTLVDRTSRSFALTPAGEDMLPRAGALLAQAEDLVRSLDQSAPLTGLLRLGIIPTIAPYLLPGAMSVLRRDHPDLKLYLREALSAEIVGMLTGGVIDIGLIAFPYEAPGLEQLVIGTDDFLFACGPDHPAATRKTVRLEDLDPTELMLLDDGHCLRDHALSACQLQPRDMANAYGGSSLQTLLQMAGSGLGTTLVPAMAAGTAMVREADVRAIPFDTAAGDTPPQREIGLIWRRGSGRTGDAEALAEALGPLLAR